MRVVRSVTFGGEDYITVKGRLSRSYAKEVVDSARGGALVSIPTYREFIRVMNYPDGAVRVCSELRDEILPPPEAEALIYSLFGGREIEVYMVVRNERWE
jgi:hypothetical protein